MENFLKFNTDKLILEGPDLSGKTSLYQSLHRSTHFRWNIQDRSSLSMVCYARQYSREEKYHRRNLYRELTRLNNRFVVLMPPLQTILTRLKERGDDCQDERSIAQLYEIFTDEVDKISRLPNVRVIRGSGSLESTTQDIVSWVKRIESCPSDFVGRHIQLFVEGAESDEHVLSLELSGNILPECDDRIMSDPLEGNYYRKIERDFENIVEKELDGINEYNQAQDMNSRRFYYSSNSCISSLHFKPRKKVLEFICCFRSTDARKNATIDLQFLEYLVHKMANKYFLDCDEFRISLSMNSAHLRNDI